LTHTDTLDMKSWDIFISHASEDKTTAALPLAEHLIRSGLRVWLDRCELMLGDSLRQKIDDGLAHSAYGVVILSNAFFAKDWPKRELDGLLAIEEGGRKAILPVWHGVDKATVARHSPLLASRLAVNTKDGVLLVAQAIARVVSHSSDASVEGSVGLTKQFIRALNDNLIAESVSAFLQTCPEVLRAAFGHFGITHDIAWSCPSLEGFGGVLPHLVVGRMMSTSGDWIWRHFYFGPAVDTGISAALGSAVYTMRAVLDWACAHSETSECRHHHTGFILVGRRDQLSRNDKKEIRELQGRRLEIRTYDWLVEACAVAERTTH
jgi:hypothetical protein